MNLSAASTVPMLDDFAITPARVSVDRAVGEPVVDRAVLALQLAGGTTILVRGDTSPRSISELTVSTFSTEPGS